ncbi:MAG TPA: hypothetical protein VJA47_00450 [archaeon]|nr:hypothetical protein [archaeon]
MQSKIILFPVLVLAVVLISGCTGFDQPTTNFGGLYVTFVSDPQQAAPGTNLRLKVAVENQADGEITDIKANIIGPIKLEQYSNKQLLKGQKDFYTWGEDSLVRAHTDEIPMNFILRLKYNYKSASVSTVPIISQQEARRRRDNNQPYPVLTQSKVSGPVTINFESLNPVVVYDVGTEFPVRITLQNIGGGNVCSGVCTDEPDKTVKLKIKYDNTKLTLLDCDSTEEVELIDTNTLNCGFKTTYANAPDVSADITLETDVEYWVEKTTSVQIKKPTI